MKKKKLTYNQTLKLVKTIEKKVEPTNLIKEFRLLLDDLWEEFDCQQITSEQLFDKTLELFIQKEEEIREKERRKTGRKFNKILKESAFGKYMEALSEIKK